MPWQVALMGAGLCLAPVLLLTFVEYMEKRAHRREMKELLRLLDED